MLLVLIFHQLNCLHVLLSCVMELQKRNKKQLQYFWTERKNEPALKIGWLRYNSIFSIS